MKSFVVALLFAVCVAVHAGEPIDHKDMDYIASKLEEAIKLVPESKYQIGLIIAQVEALSDALKVGDKDLFVKVVKESAVTVSDAVEPLMVNAKLSKLFTDAAASLNELKEKNAGFDEAFKLEQSFVKLLDEAVEKLEDIVEEQQ